MEFIQDWRFLVLTVLLTTFLGISETASLQRPSSCSKKNLLFQNRHVYMYDYVVHVSSAFLGASPSMSGSKLSCTMTIKVPRRCEHVMELSACSLMERVKGAEDSYKPVPSASQFLEDLQRYSIYFQMNSGVIIEDSILANDEDTLQVLNFKRGIISALQFPILETEEYKDPAKTSDIFGRCPVEYELDESLGAKSVTSKRNLKHCDLPNVYTKQINLVPAPSIGQMVGGVTEKPINELIYPFEMPMSCQHDLTEDKTIGTVDCLQMQYYKPLAYTGDYLVTAMTNVSQRLELKESTRKKSPKPDLSFNGQSVIDFKFDFGVHFNRASTVDDIKTSLASLVEQFGQADDSDGFETVPGKFGVFVEKLRAAEEDVLEELITEVFVCDECDHKAKVSEQVFFLDGLESCGTESCIQVFLLCMKQGHTGILESVSFLQGLKGLPQISETLLEKVFDYCRTSDETSCWLTLGTMLSKSSVSTPDDIKEGSTLYQVLDLLRDTVKRNCASDTKIDTERKLKTFVKTTTNIGFKITRLFLARLTGEKGKPVLPDCLQNSEIPTSVKISLIQSVEQAVMVLGYKRLPQRMVDTVFVVLRDTTHDTTFRALSFSLLMKTTDSNTIKTLVDIMMKEDNTKQMKAYMSSAVRTLLQNDAPDLKVVRDAWEKVKEEKHFYPRFHHFDSYSASFSKSISSGRFFKIPISEIFGGQLEADFIYDTSNKIFSTLNTAISYHYGDKKHNLFQFMLRVKDFDLLMDVLLKKIDMTPQEMFGLYKTLKARAQGQGQGDEQLAKFQQNIVKAVEKILKEVNHPTELDFDLSIDISVKGKETMFISLQEVLAYFRKVQSKFPPKVSMVQVYLKELMSGLERKAIKSKEIVGLVRDLPTCAGLPLNLTLHAYGTHVIEGTLQSNLALFMAGGKKGSSTLSVSTSPSVRFLHELHGELGVNIGTSHSSGMKATILIGVGRQMSIKATYGYSDPMVLVENPTKKKLEFQLKGIFEDYNRFSQKVLYARGKMQLTHFSGLEEIEPDHTVQATYRQCNSDQWISMITRKKMCLEFVYPDVATSKTHAYFPLSGPFNLDVTIEDVDGENVDFYTLVMEYGRKKVPGAGYTDHLDIAHIRTDHSKTETKYAYWNFVFVRDDHSLTIDSALVDFYYTYAAKFSNTWRRDFHDFTVTEMLSRYGFPVTGYVFNVGFNEENDLKVFDYHWNVTTPQIGWDFQFQAVSTGVHYRKFGDKSFDISFSYYCSKDRPLLYMFHLMPAWAMENNDVSNIRLTNSIESVVDGKQPFTGSVEFYGSKLTWDSYVHQDGPTTRAHKVLTYSVGGVQKSATMDYSHTWGQSPLGMTLDLSGNLNTENFNVISTGSCVASQKEVVVSGDVQFQNKKADDNISSRKKRSTIYDELKAVEESAVNKVLQIKDKLFGSHMMMDQPNPSGNILLHKLQDTHFPRYSIWDLEDWNATVYVSSKLKPVFGDGVTPGKARPEGLEASGTFTAQYPWNGGYVKHEELFTIGTNTRNTLRNFRVWAKGDMDTSYTTLDGTPVIDGNLPLVIKRSGEIHAYRKQGKYFDFIFNYQGPDLQKEYSILFDWDASTHHDPLYHVRSVQSGDLFPFWNHHYDEKFFIEDRDLRHSMVFSHEMLKINIDSEFNPRISKEVFNQNGSVSMKVLDQERSYEFENKAANKQFISTISPGSMPGKSFIYSINFTSHRTMSVKGSMKELEEQPVLLWNLDIQNRGSTMIEFTQSWTPAYKEQIENSLRKGAMKMSMMLQATGNHIRANMDKPVSEQTLLFVHFTPGDIIKQALMPNFIRGMKFWGRFLGNIVPIEHRPNSPGIPGPVIAPRFSMLIKAMKDSEKSGPNPMIRKLQFLDTVLLKALSKMVLSVSETEFRTQKIEEILQEGSYSYVMCTAPMIFDKLFDFPDMTEFHQHISYQAKEIFGFVRRYYKYRFLEYTSSKSVAVIFGWHSSHRELSIQTFDGNFLELSAEQSGECSYLLASDLRQRRWSLVLSPAGLTLLTPGRTVTVGWDKNIYLDNCKQPSTKITDGPVTADKTDKAINVDTSFGLSLQFDLVNDNCIVAIEGPYRNETIGLFGTNDKESFTDFRLKQGALTNRKKQFMAEYVVAGSKICMSQKEEDTKMEPECREIENTCIKAFTSQRFYKCTKYFQYHKYCKQVGYRCDNEMKPCHAVKAFKDMCHEKGLIDDSAELRGICKVETPIVESPISGTLKTTAGSVDVVFVVSQHGTMSKNDGWSIATVSDLALLDVWDQFSEVRLGVVLFGGSNVAPHVIKLEDNQYRPFTERDDYDWEGLFDVAPLTEGGTDTTDAFDAIQEAAKLPFNPVSEKIIIVLMTKEQSSGVASDISSVSADLEEKGITLHVLSTYKKTASGKINGINWEGKIISFVAGYSGKKSLPKNDYSELIISTQGVLWDLNAVLTEDPIVMKRMSDEFLTIVQQNDKQSCPAA